MIIHPSPYILEEQVQFAVRSAQRLRKKQRRREAKQAAGISPSPADVPQPCAETLPYAGTAGQCAEHVGAPAAVPAPAPASSSAAATPQPAGLQLQPPPRTNRHRNDGLSVLGIQRSDGLSDLGIGLSESNYSASDAASAGMPSQGRSAASYSGSIVPGRQ